MQDYKETNFKVGDLVSHYKRYDIRRFGEGEDDKSHFSLRGLGIITKIDYEIEETVTVLWQKSMEKVEFTLYGADFALKLVSR
jgi:hypothetical protein